MLLEQPPPPPQALIVTTTPYQPSGLAATVPVPSRDTVPTVAPSRCAVICPGSQPLGCVADDAVSLSAVTTSW